MRWNPKKTWRQMQLTGAADELIDAALVFLCVSGLVFGVASIGLLMMGVVP